MREKANLGAHDRLPLLERSRMPLYLQLETLLRKRLEAGEWRVGERVPPIPQLCAEYRVSRITLRQALAQLEKEGLISRGRGRGTFVTSDAKPVHWLLLPTDWKGLVAHIDKLNARVVTIGPAEPRPVLADSEGRPAAGYWSAQRVNLTENGTPYSHTKVHVAKHVYRRSPRAFETRPILPLLDRMRGLRIGRASQVLTVTSADVRTAELLKVEVGAPVAEVRRVVCDAGGVAIYIANVVYPSRHMRIQTELRTNP